MDSSENYLYLSQEKLREIEVAAQHEREMFLQSVEVPMSPEDAAMAEKLAFQQLRANADRRTREAIDKGYENVRLDTAPPARRELRIEVSPDEWVRHAEIQRAAMEETFPAETALLNHYRRQANYRITAAETVPGNTPVVPDK